MSLVNLGFDTDPGNLTETLKAHGGFNSRGWIIWNAISDATGGEAKVTVFRDGNADHVRQCLAKGDYPLIRFTLANGAKHWLVVLEERSDGFYVRDPYEITDRPVHWHERTTVIESVRCVGVEE